LKINERFFGEQNISLDKAIAFENKSYRCRIDNNSLPLTNK